MSETEKAVVDVEAVMPVEARITVNGCPCRVRRLKTREFLSLVNVLTQGLGSSLSGMKVDFTNSETVAADLSAVMVLALPNAVDEFTVFLRNVVEPISDKDRAKVGGYLM